MLRRRGAELLTLAVLLGLPALGACDGRQPLMGGPDGSTGEASPLLPGDSIVREGLVLRVGVRGSTGSRAVELSLVLLDSSRAVVWRSLPALTDSGAARVPVEGLPPAAVGRPLLLTALAEQGGRRVYAGSDTAGATSLASAGVQRVRVLGGRSVSLGGQVRSLVTDGRRGLAYVAQVGSGDVGVLDLAGGGLASPLVRDRGEVWDLAAAGNTLAYLGDAGSRVSFVSLPGGEPVAEGVLGPLVVKVSRRVSGPAGETRVDSLTEVVRPYASALRISCDDGHGECVRPVAVLASPTQGGGSVIRLLRPGGESVLVAGFAPLSGGADTVPATVAVFGASRPGGDSQPVLERSMAAGCASLRFGVAGFAASETGSLFAGGGDGCGPAARLVRVDAFGGLAPTLSRLAAATMLAEDRIRGPVEIVAAADGSRLLVREADAIWLLDRDLRVLGFRAVSARARVAWLDGQTSGARAFILADAGVIQVFEADRFGMLESVDVGPLAGAPVGFAALPDGRRVAVFVPAERLASVVVVTFQAR